MWNLGKYSLRTNSNMWTFKPLTLSFSICITSTWYYVQLFLCVKIISFEFSLRTSIWTDWLFLTDFNYVYLIFSCMCRKMYVLSNLKKLKLKKTLKIHSFFISWCDGELNQYIWPPVCTLDKIMTADRNIFYIYFICFKQIIKGT